MERENIERLTPVEKHKCILKAWLTGREKRAISEVLLKGANFLSDEGTKPTFSGELINKAQDIAITTVLVSIDGKTEDILNIVLDMRGEDFDFIVEEISKVTNPTIDLKK
jgi:hypothetical protein